MSLIGIVFKVMVVGTIVLAPFFGAEDRPAFRWPDRKPRRMV